MAQELDARLLVEPHRVAIVLPLVAAVEIPGTPRRLECARIALHAVAVPHNRHAVRPYLAESEARLLRVHDPPFGVNQLRDKSQERKFERSPQRWILPLRLFCERDELLVLSEYRVAEGAASRTVRRYADLLLAVQCLDAQVAKRCCRTRLKRHFANRRYIDRLALARNEREVLLLSGADKVRDVCLKPVLVAVLSERRRLLPVDV